MNLVETLLDQGLISAEQVAEAKQLSHQQRFGGRVDRALVELGHMDEEQLLKMAGEQLAIPLVDLSNQKVDAETIALMPPRFVHRKMLMPLDRSNGTIRVATSDPYDFDAFEELRLMTGLQVDPVLAVQDQVKALIKTYYGLGGDTIDQMMDDEGFEKIDDKDAKGEDLLQMAQEASVIKLVNQIFLEGVDERASDIHIEPFENDLKIRYRIDGVLQDASVPAQVKQFQSAIVSRIKIMANLNIAEKRLPQDGRIKLQAGGRQIDIRVSVIPMLFGEGVVMRILDKANVLFTLQQLGMSDHEFELFEQQITRPHGIILVTGPTGSGKTTTLYAALSTIISEEIKVLTVEDPVEYHLDGVNQIQVNPKVEMTFARGLRAILRHDPDVVMIGEIRDRETADAAIQAALTGHLVFSTLHTNDSCSAPTRLVDMGIEPFLVTSTVIAAMAQRLVRIICPHCKVERSLEDYRESLPKNVELDPARTLYQGTGCRRCHHSGYRGRTGLYELMIASDAVNEKIMERAPTHVIEQAARSQGLRLLVEDGFEKIYKGITTPHEVLRCTKF
jgi:type II secretion system protein E